MCRYRHVRNVYVKCNHSVNLPVEEIKCDQTTCIFSPDHPPNCSGDACKARCWQYHQYPQQYSPNINEYCPDCQAHGAH